MKRLLTAADGAKILVADDDEPIRSFVAETLRGDGYAVMELDPAAGDFSLCKEAYDVAILDIVMPVKDGFAVREELLKHSPGTQIIMMTAYPDSERLHQAVELGIHAFLPKPFRADHIRYAVLGALRIKQLLDRNSELEMMAVPGCVKLVGNSACAHEMRRRIMECAPLDVPVLITGESGAGKEVVAECVHHYSRRRDKPFVALNCASLAPSLIESELFGHVQGAFTGATKAKHGFFEAADGGTLFLDEIADLPIELQTRLLRILDKGEFFRVGETNPRTVDVRILSATNRDLEEMVENGRFRRDLLYRIRGAHIHVAPLRERREDIDLLARYFLGEGMAIAPEAIEILRSLDWPGNIRELSMVVRNLQGLCANRLVTADIVKKATGMQGAAVTGAQSDAYAGARERFDREYFGALMQSAHGNISKASAVSGIHRKNLREKLKGLGLYKPGA